MEAFVAAADDHAVGGHGRRGHEGKSPVAVLPKDLPLLDIDAEQFVFVVADVEQVALHGPGSCDVRAGFDFPQFLAADHIDHMDDGVAATEGGSPAGNGRRAIDVIARLVDPVRFSGGGLEAVEPEVVAADKDVGGGSVGAGDPVGAALDFVVKALAPQFGPGLGVEGEEVGQGVTDEDAAVEDQGRRLHRPAGSEGPAFAAV